MVIKNWTSKQLKIIIFLLIISLVFLLFYFNFNPFISLLIPSLRNNLTLMALEKKYKSTEWYIDNKANGNNSGNSWRNAWPGLSKVNWTSIKGGDIIYISGGIKSKTYTDSMNIKASGSYGNPITITVGANSPYPEGHSGKVLIDLNYEKDQYSVFRIKNQSYINISGKINNSTDCNIKTTRSRYNGVYIEGTSSNFNISYLEISNNGTDFGFGIYMILNQDNNLGEIHHCIIYNNRTDAIRALDYPEFTATTFGSLKIHHNNIYDFHGDAVKIYLGGVDFYNNIIHDRGTYLTDHPDGIQADDSYLRIYNNHFYNFIRTDKDPNLNSYIRYGDFNGKAVKNTYIYNNIFAETREDGSGSVFRCIEMAFSKNVSEVSNIYFVNNTIIGIPLFGVYVGFGDNVNTNMVTDVYIVNNIFLDASNNNSPILLNTGDETVKYGSQGDNVNVICDYNIIYSNSSKINKQKIGFNKKTLNYEDAKRIIGIQKHGLINNPEVDNNYYLSKSSPAIGAGINLYHLFTIDKNNTNRPSKGAWDLGAFIYKSINKNKYE